MEFWGVEVKSGKPLSVELEENRVMHISQACLGEGKDKGNEPIYLYVTINEKKIVLGTLCPKKFPQQQFDLMFEKTFQLSHSWKKGTVNFFGYECDQPDESDLSDYGSDSESEKDIPLQVAREVNGKPAAQAANQKVTSVGPVKDVKQDSNSSDGSGRDSSEVERDSDEDEDSESDSSDSEADVDKAEETPKKVEKASKKRSADFEADGDKAEETPKKVEKASKKRSAESASETPGKKTKFVTPKKTGADNKKSNVHVDTPYPSKQAGKTSANQSKQKTSESAGSYCCKPCKRSFNSEKALESHSKAKHSGEK